jgi:effector-binding domain-containing protein
MPCGLFYTWDEAKLKSDMAAALPTLAQLNNIPETNTVSIPSKPALKIVYHGDKRKSGNAHNAMGDYMKDRQLLMDVPMIEEYVTDPTKESDPEKWITNIIYYYTKK